MDLLFDSGYVTSSRLVFIETRMPDGRILQVRLEGSIECAPPVVVEVTKWMDVRYVSGVPEVLSTYYRYHAWRRDRRSRPVLRCDCAHGDAHIHRFDRFGGEEHQSITLDEVPRLDDFVYEAVDISRGWDSLESGS